jgi:PTH1 family peptidyl-tRNA hydrolase
MLDRDPLADTKAGATASAAAGERWIVVGLGNPGPQYVATRHNAGFLVADELAERHGARFSPPRGGTARLRSDIATIAVPRIVLAKPTSYMNESGGPVAAVCAYFRAPLDRLVVIHDELDLPYGTVRLKRGGGDNGHNGLRSITRALGPDYYRVRIGIGRPPGRMDPAAYVLRDFSKTELADIAFVVDRAADAAEALITSGLDAAQNTIHALPEL